MESIDANQYTSKQLREWLKQLGLPTHGNKGTLALRLSEVPASIRGDCPGDGDDEIEQVCLEEPELPEDHLDLKAQNESLLEEIWQLKQTILELHSNRANSGITANNSITPNNGGDTNKKSHENSDAASSGNERACNEAGDRAENNASNAVGYSVANSDRAANDDKAADGVTVEIETNARNEVNASMSSTLVNSANNVETGNKASGGSTANSGGELNSDVGILPFDIIKDMLPEYDGGTNINTWIQQFNSVGSVYNLSENTLRALMANRLRGKAQAWLHSKPTFLVEHVEVLVSEMRSLFLPQRNKLLLRKKFETRKWQAGEDFYTYYNDKIASACGLNIEESELIDHVIEGIPDEHLRTQAYIQCFSNKEQLLQAFGRVELKSSTSKAAGIRCYNCNSVGHMATECKKPKRERGACYSCGSKEHKVAACPKRKTVIHAVEENQYNAY
ncbi:PREDICTED: uncharacterized protein LOC108375074 [Rhagoletis zephyria]|uniref:uncharacterized protein LOC108375074 n=1 Tax=Rhagoletis zephyria TaxID=28612 RepID=UPI0008112FDF|nr:PREDICTED: uncharacterized protein LOC108375074 [Rhagoletis zephyria]